MTTSPDPTTALISQVRSMVGDFASPFRDVFTGGDELSTYDLSESNIAGGVTVTVVDTATGVSQVIQNYTLDYREGRILLGAPYAPLPHGKLLIVEGTTSGMFSDDDMRLFFNDAFAQHTHGRTIEQRYRDGDPSIGAQPAGYGNNSYGGDSYGDTAANGGTGFIRYRYVPITMENIDPVELYPLALLTAQMVLWTLLLDASTDIDISTSEGVFVPRTQRFHQLMQMQDLLQQRYKDICAQLDIGLYRMEVLNLRRISRTTNRLVPLFKSREYDDAAWPQRILPPIDAMDADESGLPSPWLGGVWG